MAHSHFGTIASRHENYEGLASKLFNIRPSFS
jgi:hypothetical protein